MSIQPNNGIGSLFRINGKANSNSLESKAPLSAFGKLEEFQNKIAHLEKEQIKTKKNNKKEIAECQLQITLCQEEIKNPKKVKR